MQFWGDRLPIIPEIQGKRGKGSAQLYSERNLIEFGLVDMLVGEGVPLERIGPILGCLHSGRFRSDVKTEVVFDDFYTNPAWGDTKELVFITDRLDKKSGFPLWFAVVQKGKNWAHEVGKSISESRLSRDDYGSIVLLKLGTMKKRVLKKLGVGK